MNPFISICIPAYKNAAFLDILMKSVVSQVFRDFEVIITDDSPDNEVEQLCERYKSECTLTYHKNTPAAGSPANWNRAIGLAKGTWIKIMHDDDWFAHERSLQQFADAAKSNPSTGFIFSGYSNYEKGMLKNTFIPGDLVQWKLKRSPLNLFAKNYIGHPSTTLIKNNLPEWYDEKIKWVVDFEFYIRCLSTNDFYMIREPLIHIGISSEQITRSTFRNIAVEIPENLYMLNKMGVGILKNRIVFDHYWRLFRNLNIRHLDEVNEYAMGNMVPDSIKKLLRFQFTIPLPVLRFGPFSKLLMLVAYFRN